MPERNVWYRQQKAEGLRQAILEDIKLSEKRMEKGIPAGRCHNMQTCFISGITKSYRKTQGGRKER